MSLPIFDIARSMWNMEADPDHFETGAAVFGALGASSNAQIETHLKSLQGLGVDLRLMGPLALLSGKKKVAEVLLEKFGVKIEDYMTHENDTGRYGDTFYPYLAHLAYKSGLSESTRLQRLALRWGADPSAEWAVESSRGHYHHNEHRSRTIGWISENIASGNLKMVDALCAKETSVPSKETRSMRALALFKAANRAQGNDTGEFPSLIRLLVPGGKHDLGISPWDVQGEEESLAVLNTVVHARHNQYVGAGKNMGLIENWIKETAGGRDKDCLAIAKMCCAQFSFGNSFPSWVVDHLSPEQAQEALKIAWLEVFKKWAQDSGGAQSKFTLSGAKTCSAAEASLSSSISPFKALSEKAQRSSCTHGFETPEYLIGSVLPYVIGKFTVKGVDALADLYPKFPGAPSAAEVLLPLRDLIREKEQPLSPMKGNWDDRLNAFIESCKLRAEADGQAAEMQRKAPAITAPHRASLRL